MPIRRTDVAATGAAMLDRAYPGWADSINVAILDQCNIKYDVLGQLFGDYAQGVWELFGLDVCSDEATPYVVKYGFAQTTFTARWRDEIIARQLMNRNCVMTFKIQTRTDKYADDWADLPDTYAIRTHATLESNMTNALYGWEKSRVVSIEEPIDEAKREPDLIWH